MWSESKAEGHRMGPELPEAPVAEMAKGDA